MPDNPTGPDIFATIKGELSDATMETPGSALELSHLLQAQVAATQSQTAALVMLTEVIATATGTDHYDLDAWRQVIPSVPLKECRAMNIRRPECAERHTDDCDYTDPVPEPKHVLLPVGIRVLVSDPHDTNCGCGNEQPWVGIVRGYDMHRSKYQISEERYGTPGEYYDFVRWVFADNRVQPLDEQPAPEPDSALASLLSRFERVWDCEVVRTGYHNGAVCTPGEPHGGWNCGYVWKFPSMTDAEARRFGLITDSTKDDG